jgi:hypothetical protein
MPTDPAQMNYARNFMPLLVPQLTTGRLIYLDIDVLVLGLLVAKSDGLCSLHGRGSVRPGIDTH